MSLNIRNISLFAARWILGALFLFSGFVKSIDPVGTSIYVEKYLAAYSLSAIMPAAQIIAVVLSVAEVMLGVMLIMRVRQKTTAFAAALFLSLFTVITLLNATVLPIGDCGCFGDALYLSPWATFLKNILLLPLAVALWRMSPRHSAARRDYIITVFAVLVPLLVNVYALRHLPLVDFMPYKVDTALRDEVLGEREAAHGAAREIVVCQHPESGEVCEFEVSDAQWYDWDVIDTRVEMPNLDMRYADFRLYDTSGEECSEAVLMREGRVAWLCIADDKELEQQHLAAIDRLFDAYPKSHVVILTSGDAEALAMRFGVDSYAVDAMTLRSMMRARVGVIILDNGVIIDKRSFRDI